MGDVVNNQVVRVPRAPFWLLVAPAAVFAVVLLGTALLAARTLRERDAAVREGLLLRAGHALEVRLRESSPDEAAPVLAAFLSENRTVAGVAVLGPEGVLATAGVIGAGAVEMPAGLGRGWRARAFGDGAGRGGRASAGPEPGGGRGPGVPPFRLRLAPAAELGRSSGVALATATGGVAAAVTLVALAVVAARGLAERQRREIAEAESARLQTVALAGAGLAHQLRNPLAVIKGTAQHLEGRVPEAERERLERIVASSGRIETILARLLEFARPPSPQPSSFDLTALAREVSARSGPGIEVVTTGEVTARADREHAESILEELLANARAFDPGGRIEVAVRREGRAAILAVADRGPGLEIDSARAFEPYVTSRPDGTGLGLAIVSALAAANSGRASLAARPGGGCIASLSLPVAEG